MSTRLGDRIEAAQRAASLQLQVFKRELHWHSLAFLSTNGLLPAQSGRAVWPMAINFCEPSSGVRVKLHELCRMNPEYRFAQ